MSANNQKTSGKPGLISQVISWTETNKAKACSVTNAFGDGFYILSGVGAAGIQTALQTGSLNGVTPLTMSLIIGGAPSLLNNIPLYLWGDKQYRAIESGQQAIPRNGLSRFLQSLNPVTHPLEFTGWVSLWQTTGTLGKALHEVSEKGASTPLVLTISFAAVASIGAGMMVAFDDSKYIPPAANDNAELLSPEIRTQPTDKKTLPTIAAHFAHAAGNAVCAAARFVVKDMKDSVQGMRNIKGFTEMFAVNLRYDGLRQAFRRAVDTIEQGPPTVIAARFFTSSLYLWGAAMAFKGEYAPLLCALSYRGSNFFLETLSKPKAKNSGLESLALP